LEHTRRSAEHPFRDGQILADKYQIERVLGEGGMGVVVAARHLHLDERVAVKFMLPQVLADREAVARFTREARAAVKIKSEHVARVSDVGLLDNGAPYLVMEYLEGSDLSVWLRQHGRLPVEQAVEFVLQACEALAEAHALGIVHRDLKPANLFVIRRPDGALSVKVLDFGISKLTSQGGTVADFDMTKTSAVMGSPNYMSPEQMRSSKDVDFRSDIWAVGVILYELLSGQLPFIAPTYPELVLKIATEAPVPLRSHASDLPPALENVIAKCLDKDPGRRFATIGELAAALVVFGPKRARVSLERISGVLRAAGLSATALALPPSFDSTTPAGVGTAASWGKTAPSRSGGRRVLLLVIGMLGLGAVAIASSALRHASRTEPSSNAASTAAAHMAAEPAPPMTEQVASALPATVQPTESPKPAAPPPSSEATAAPRSAANQADSGPAPSAAPRAMSPTRMPATLPSVAPTSPVIATPKPDSKSTTLHPHSVFDDR
jgi:serine/threonine protein kinase